MMLSILPLGNCPIQRGRFAGSPATAEERNFLKVVGRSDVLLALQRHGYF